MTVDMDSGLAPEPVIGPAKGRARWARPGMPAGVYNNVVQPERQELPMHEHDSVDRDRRAER